MPGQLPDTRPYRILTRILTRQFQLLDLIRLAPVIRMPIGGDNLGRQYHGNFGSHRLIFDFIVTGNF